MGHVSFREGTFENFHFKHPTILSSEFPYQALQLPRPNPSHIATAPPCSQVGGPFGVGSSFLNERKETSKKLVYIWMLEI